MHFLYLTDEKTNNDYSVKKRTTHFGSFYLRVGAISFGIGTMVYSGLEFGQYFELNRKIQSFIYLFMEITKNYNFQQVTLAVRHL